MKGDIPGPAFRLLALLPVRTIEARPERRTYRERQGQQKGIEIEGRFFQSMKEAKRELGYGYDRIKRLIGKGMARYV